MDAMKTKTVQETIDGFLDSLNTHNTRRSYSTPLAHFVTSLHEGTDAQTAPASALTVDHAIAFVGWLRAYLRKLNPEGRPKQSTVELYTTAVYRFYRHLLLQGHDISHADLARLEEVYKKARDIRGNERPIEHTLEAVAKVCEAARAVQVPPGAYAEQRRLVRLRNIAVVESLRATGCRISELIGLRLADLGPDQQSALVKGKGNKWRHVYWDERGWAALRTYLRERGLTPEDAQANVPLFVGHGNRNEGKRVTVRHVARTIQKLGESVGEPDVSAHYFRHVFATRALDKTDNLAVVQDLLGHASPTTTRVYAQTDEEQRRATHAEIWK